MVLRKTVERFLFVDKIDYEIAFLVVPPAFYQQSPIAFGNQPGKIFRRLYIDEHPRIEQRLMRERLNNTFGASSQRLIRLQFNYPHQLSNIMLTQYHNNGLRMQTKFICYLPTSQPTQCQRDNREITRFESPQLVLRSEVAQFVFSYLYFHAFIAVPRRTISVSYIM